MANAPATPTQAAQVKRELIVTRLAHRLGLRQETAWARYSELRKAAEEREKQQQERDGDKRPSGFVELRPAPRPDAALPTTEKPRGGAKAGPAVQAERQLVELLLADPGLVPVAAASVKPDEVTHTGLRRLLTEMYAVHAAGAVPDVEALRARLEDRPDLFEAVEKLLFVGQQMTDREQWLQRVLKVFAELKAKAKANALKEQLAAAPDDAQAIEELLRRLQRANAPKSDD
jgi:DNA primase